MKNKIIRRLAVCMATALVLTEPVATVLNLNDTVYAATKFSKEKKAAAEYLRKEKCDKFAFVDVTGDDVPDLLAIMDDALFILKYKNGAFNLYNLMSAGDVYKIKYYSEIEVLYGYYKSTTDEKTVDGFLPTNVKKIERVGYWYTETNRSETEEIDSYEVSREYITYKKSKKPKYEYSPSKKEYNDFSKVFSNAGKTIKFTKNTSDARAKLMKS